MNDKSERIIELIKADRSVDAPAETVKWVKNLFAVFAAQTTEQRPLLRRIIAALQTEISPGTAVFGERSSGGTTERSLVFSADEGNVVIQIEITGTRRKPELLGQILGTKEQDPKVRLMGAGESKESIAEAGQFHFVVKHGNLYQVAIEYGTDLIETDEFQI